MTAVHRVLAVVATMLVLVGTVAGVVHREVLDADRFSAHVDSIRADPAVARQLGVLVTDRLLAAQPDLTAVRPLLESTAASVVASPALAPAIRIAMVGPLYRTLTGGGGDSVVLRLADVAAVVIGATAVAAPQTRAALPAELDVRLSQFGARGSTGEVLGWVHLVTWVSWLAPLAGLLILVGSGATLGAEGPGMRRRLMGALTATGRGVLAAAVTLAVLLVLTGVLVGRQDDSTLTGALLRATWQELDGAFWDAAGILAVAGLALAAAGRSGPTLFARDVQPADLAARAWSAVLHPRPGLGRRTGRAGLLLLVGIALLLQPLEVLRALLWAMGLGLVVVAVAVLVSVATTAVRERSVRHDSDARARHGAGWRWVLAGLGLVVLITVLVLGALPGRDSIPVARASDSETCNGYVVLCQRRYNDVAFPATHNAMAAADQPGWFFAEQPDGLIPQLEHGIRVLLIDSWYGQHSQRPGIIVNTDQDRVAALAEARASFGEAAVESALRVRHALRLTPRGPVEPYLCHALCALGSTPWLPAMTEVRTWLAAHPRNVVTLFVQDTVSPQDTATVMRRAGLLPYVYTPAGDQQQWPSLGQMIESGERLVILMENHGGGSTYPWLLDGFHWVQDTPFLFRSPAQFSCRDNRGPATAPLFLLNHWITQKHREVSNAALVNARDVLLPRAEECRRQRGRRPNFVAVDFYDKGDLFGVVNTLNRTP